MSVRESLRKVFYDHLMSQFPTEYGSAVPIGTENSNFEQPKNTPFLLCWIKMGKSKRASIGTTQRFNRYVGHFLIDCIVPEKTGSAVVNSMADAASDVFEAQKFQLDDGSDCTTFVPSVYGDGKAQDGFYYLTVMIPFTVEAKPKR